MIPVKSVLYLSMGLIVAAAGAGIYLMLWGPDHIEWEGKSVGELLAGGELLTIAGVAVSLLVAAAVLWSTFRTLVPPEIKNAVAAPARVLKVWDTGTTINDDPQVGLLLEVTPATGAPFQAEAKTLVSRLQVALVQPGVAAEVKYDPLNPQRLQVVSIDTPAGAPGAVARMEELNALHDRGLITDEEYREKRAEILRAL